MSRHLHIDLELDADDELRGSASDGRRMRAFAGWLGLIAALDALIEPVHPYPTEPWRGSTT